MLRHFANRLLNTEPLALYNFVFNCAQSKECIELGQCAVEVWLVYLILPCSVSREWVKCNIVRLEQTRFSPRKPLSRDYLLARSRPLLTSTLARFALRPTGWSAPHWVCDTPIINWCRCIRSIYVY